MFSFRTTAQSRQTFFPLYVTLLFVGVLHAMGNLLIAFPQNWSREDLYLDTAYYYTAAERVRGGEPLYWPWPEYGPHMLTEVAAYPYERSPYPPFVAPALAPLTVVPYKDFARFAYIPFFLAFWIYAASLAKLATGRVTLGGVLIAGWCLGVMPGSYVALSSGQLDTVLWALFGLALAFRPLRAFAFSLSAMVKLYCAWPLLLAWRHEGSRIFYRAAGTVLAGVLVGMAVMGPLGYLAAFVDWARYMLPVVGQGTFNPYNVSISFAGLRLLTEFGWEYVPGPLPTWARLYLTVMSVSGPLLTAWLTRKRDPVFQYAVVTCAAVLFSPLCWTTYLPLLLAPGAIAARSLISPLQPSGPGADRRLIGDRVLAPAEHA